jgi:hypothetical protein
VKILTEEMFLHCMKHTPRAFQQNLINLKDVDAIIILLNWNCVEGCFYTFDEMKGYIDIHNKEYKSKEHWSFMVSQINKSGKIDSFSLCENHEYIRE